MGKPLIRSHPWLALVLAALLLAVLAGSATAHASLRRSEPPHGALRGPGLQRVIAWFDLPLQAEASTLQVFDASGARVDIGDGKVDPADPARQSMLVHLPIPLRPGGYTVRWRVTSDEGLHTGHITESQFSFWVSDQIDRLTPGWALAGLGLAGALASLVVLLWPTFRAAAPEDKP